MVDEQDVGASRYCPICGAEAKPEISNCESCWRPLPIGASGTPPMEAPDWTLKSEPADDPRKNDSAPAFAPPPPTGNQSATGEQVPAREPAASANGRKGKKAILIAAIVLVLIVGGVIAKSATSSNGTPDQTLSYKDGVAMASGVTNPTEDGTNWVVNEASIGNNASTACGILVELKAADDNRSEWLQGCIAEFNRLLYLSNHPGANSGDTGTSGNT